MERHVVLAHLTVKGDVPEQSHVRGVLLWLLKLYRRATRTQRDA